MSGNDIIHADLVYLSGNGAQHSLESDKPISVKDLAKIVRNPEIIENRRGVNHVSVLMDNDKAESGYIFQFSGYTYFTGMFLYLSDNHGNLQRAI